MKQLLTVLGIIMAVAAVTVVILKKLPTPTIREDFICE